MQAYDHCLVFCIFHGKDLFSVTKQFPYLHVSTEDCERYPEFTNLLSALTGYITAEGVTIQTSKDLQQVSHILH